MLPLRSTHRSRAYVVAGLVVPFNCAFLGKGRYAAGEVARHFQGCVDCAVRSYGDAALVGKSGSGKRCFPEYGAVGVDAHHSGGGIGLDEGYQVAVGVDGRCSAHLVLPLCTVAHDMNVAVLS